MAATTISKDGVALPPPVGTPPVKQPLPPEVYEYRGAVALALREQGMSIAGVGRALGVHPDTVRAWIARAKKEAGKVADIHAILEKDTVHRALEVLHEHLEEGNLEAALATLKGRGIFRNYTNSNAEGGNSVTGIQIIYTTPNGAAPPQLVDVATLPGQVIGTPRLDAPKAESEP